MSALTIVVMILQVICAVALITIVTLQSSKDSGLSGAIGGGSSDSFFGKGKSKSRDAILASATKWVATAFIVLTFLLSLI